MIKIYAFMPNCGLKKLSDKFMFISVPHDSITYLHITFIIYIYDVLATLQPLSFYMYISHNSTLDLFKHTLQYIRVYS